MEKLTGPWNEYQPSAPATDSGPWDEFKPQAEQPKSYGLKDFGGDLASVVTKGVMAVPQAAVGLADIATGGRAGKALEDIGVRFNDANQIADSWKSDALKAQQKDFQQAEGLAGKTAAALRSPGLLMSVVGESVPSMFAGGALAKGVGLAAPALAGRAGLAAAGEGAVMAGSQAESIRQQTDDGLLTAKQSALAAGTGLAGGAIGALGAKAAKSLGIGDVDTMIANGATQGAAREGLGLVSRVGRGALSEGVLEELPQSLTETALGNIALDRNVTQGMDEAAVLGTLSGGLMGGAAGALSRPAVKPSQAMGLDPAAGPLSRAAATAVDSGATPTIQPEQVNAEQTQADPAVAQAADAAEVQAADAGQNRGGMDGGQLLPASSSEGNQQPVPVVEPLPLEARSLDELRQSLRNAQDPAIRKTVAAEIRRRRESMPDPLSQPQQEPASVVETVKPVETGTQESQAPAEPAAAVLGQPLTETGTNMLGRGADPLQSLIQEENNVRRAADSLRNGSNGSSGAGPNLADSGMANDVGVPDGTAGTAAPVIPESVQSSVGEQPASGQAALRPERWRQNALQAGKVARTLGLDPRGKRLAQIVAEIDAKDEWKSFDASTGTLNVPRADMPQIKAEHRGAMVNFLSARGVTSEQGEVEPVTLKPTQAEFSIKKVEKATKFDGNDRSILVSADNHVVDGHHQWLAKMATGQPVKVIRLNAPIADLLPLVRDFPSSTVDEASNVQNAPQAANDGQAQAAPVEASTPARGDAASNGAVSAAPGAGDVQADGVNLSKKPQELNTSAEPVQETAKTEQVAKAPAEPVNPIPPAKKVDRAASLRKAEWKKNPLRSFLGQHGLSLDLAKEFAPGIAERRKAMVGGYGPIFRKAGKNLDLLAETAREEGFISTDQDATDLYELVAAVFRGERVAPMFTADAAKDEMQARMDAMQEQSNAEFEDFIGMESADPFGPLNDDEIAATGYDAADDKIKAEVDALIAMADTLGIDTETIREDAARETAEQSEQVYYVQARRILTQAIAQSTGSSGNDQAVESRPGQREEAKPRSNADRGTDSGGKGEQSGLTAPTRRDIEAQQASTEQADKLDERAQVKRESELGDTSFMTGFSGDGRQDNTGSLFDVADQSSTETTYTPAPDAQKKAVTAFADRLSKNRDSFVLMDAVKPSGARQQEAQSVANLAKTMFGREAVFVKFKGRPLFNGAVSTTDPGKIFVNIESARPMMAVLGHELLHELRKSNPAAYNQLAKTLKTVTKDDYIYEALLKKKYRDQGLNWTPQDISEELYGDIVGDNFMDPKFWEAIAGDKPIFAKQLYRAVMNWLDKIASMFKRVKVRQDGSMVLTLAEQADGSRPFGTQKYLQDIEAARAAVAQAMGQFKQGGEGKDALAISDRQDQTDTPAFKRWFGESKVVDSAGKPLRVFHGTRREFNVFEPMKPRGAFGNPVGIYFSSDKSEAQQFAEDADGATDEKSRVVEAYLKIESDKDGIIRKRADGTTEYIVFRPEQIKSATGNNGNFDPANPDIRFSIADAVEQIKQFDVKTAPKNTWAHYRGMAMQALGRRQIVDLYAEELPQLEHYNDLVQRMDAEKNETGAEADKLAQDWSKLKDGEDRKLAELMHDATLSQVDPSKAMPAGFSKKDYDALKGRYDAMTTEAKRLFGEARDMYADHFRAVQKAIKERIERSEMSDGQKRQIMAKMDEELFKELKGVYFPLARFGQYVIVVKDANGEVKNVTRAETVSEAEEARKELMKAFPKLMGNTVGKVLKQAEFNAGRDAVGKGFMADLMGALDAKGVDDELRDTVAQLYLSSLPDLSWAKHGIHRKGTPGFSQDARRAFAQNMFHGARYLAKLRYADQLQDDLIEMQEHVKAYEGVEEYDSVEAQQVVDEMVKRHEILMNPKSSPVSTALTSFGFLFHMGLSPASAMVNLTQTALVAFPQMGAKWGFTKSSAALLKASEEVVRAKNDLATVLKGDELDALNRAIKDGTIDVTMAHDLAGIAQGEDQGVMWKIRPVMRWASFMFHHAEKFNRQATFIAAYRLAKESSPGRDFDRLYEDAKKVTYDGHYDYSASNRPRVMQGNWQRVILLFKSFAQNTIYTLARNAHQSIMALDPKERTQARKALGGLLATHAAAAGVLGLPIVGPLLTIASWIGGDDDEPWDAEVAMQNAMAELMGPKAAEVMARGLSRLTPWDLSGRVALNKLILPDVQEGLQGKEWAESAMAAALGPVAGIGINVARGVQKITEGDYMRGMEDMLPTALRGPIKALRYADEGAVDKTGIVITDEVSAAGVLGQASGFSPSQVRRDTERRSAIYGYDKALLERRSVLMRMFAEARIQGDAETAQEVQADIQKFNEKHPNRRITGMNLAQSIRNRRKRVAEAEHGVYLPRKRRDALDAVSF